MALEITPVESRRDLNTFLRFPWIIYRGSRHWVPPVLDELRDLFDPAGDHPFRDHNSLCLFLARRDGKPVGRIVAIDNRQHVGFHGEPAGFFGFFESIDDGEVADALIAAASDWLRQRDLTIMRGPMNPSTNDNCGLLIEGFDEPPAFMMPYNPPYYVELLEGAGLTKAKDLLCYRKDLAPSELDSAQLKRVDNVVVRQAARQGIEVRTPDMKRFDEELEIVKRVYNGAWEKNWGFVPMTEREFDQMAARLKRLVDPRFVVLATVRGEPAGFTLMLPDYNQPLKQVGGQLWPLGIPWILASVYLKRIRSLRVLTMGVVEEHRRKGVEAAMMQTLFRHAYASHYDWCEVSWVLEDNRMMNNQLQAWQVPLTKRYRVYERSIV